MKIILCDIHQTLLNERQLLNESVALLLKALGSQANIKVCLVTASTLDNNERIKLENYFNKKGLHFEIFSNRLGNVEDDEEIKVDLLNQVKGSYPNEDIILALDNKKEIAKMYRHHGIDSMRFKGAKDA